MAMAQSWEMQTKRSSGGCGAGSSGSSSHSTSGDSATSDGGGGGGSKNKNSPERCLGLPIRSNKGGACNVSRRERDRVQHPPAPSPGNHPFAFNAHNKRHSSLKRRSQSTHNKALDLRVPSCRLPVSCQLEGPPPAQAPYPNPFGTGFPDGPRVAHFPLQQQPHK